MDHVYLFTLKKFRKETPFNIIRIIAALSEGWALESLEEEVKNSPYGESAEDYVLAESHPIFEEKAYIVTIFNNEMINGSTLICGIADSTPHTKIKPMNLSNSEKKPVTK